MSRAPWPLTGRMERLEAIGREHRAGTVGGVVVHGLAGVGKTRLAEEALARAERSGRPAARAVGVQPLTAREREVALLAARGRSSREIADTLYLSTRTVETHLARVYRKLGISTRSGLAAALGTSRGT
jgi:DNA-binding CsgD family transcriptional regulator